MNLDRDLSPRIVRSLAAGACALFLIATAPLPAHAIRLTTWNLTMYPSLSLSARQPQFRTVMDSLKTDIMIVQEVSTQAGADSFLTNVLQVVQPKHWGEAYIASTESAVYWDSTVVTGSNFTPISTSGPRDVLQCLMKPIGYVSSDAWFRIYSIHLKAGGPNTVDTTTRKAECTDLRNFINNIDPAGVGPAFLIGGDSNFYSANEGGYVKLTESEADNDGRAKDPLNMPGSWHIVSAYRNFVTQCPCLNSCPAGFSGGGLDDRFDIWLSSYSMQDGQGLDLVLPSGYIAFGNDGFHFDQDVNGSGFNNQVGFAVASALHDASDHLPVIVTVQVPAKIAAGPSAMDFGTVIQDFAASQMLSISNPALPPADALTYTMSVPAGFSAPAGSFDQAAAAPATNQPISLVTSAPGNFGGTLTVSCDDPDSPTQQVALSGHVRAHASPSLDSSSVVVSEEFELSAYDYGGFPDSTLRVHNFGYNALQARLSLDSGAITGGDGRFTIVGGFSPLLLSDVGQSYTIHFDDTAATQDSIYEATLTFSSTDEPLPGASARPNLAVRLRALLYSGTTGVHPGSTPSALRFYPPRPNPLTNETRFAFDLPRPSPVSLEIYDLSGRRVASLISGTQGAGHREVSWKPTDAAGARLAGGLYFARFVTPGAARVERVVLLP
jgi:hypothetical protein